MGTVRFQFGCTGKQFPEFGNVWLCGCSFFIYSINKGHVIFTMAKNRRHGMITMNHQLDWCSMPAGVDEAGKDVNVITPAQRAWCRKIVDYHIMGNCKPLKAVYGVAVCELGTGEDSHNFHIHVAFKGNYGPQKAPQAVQTMMKKHIVKDSDYPTGDARACEHIDITYKHGGGKRGMWKWNDMVEIEGDPVWCA